jgi:hypothetical protein
LNQNTIVIQVTALRRIFVMLFVLIALILVVLFVRSQLQRPGVSALFAQNAADLIDRASYQAVFLTNGSTFFGRLQQQGDDWFVLSDVFYLTTSQDGGTQLIKRGSEPQGPREPMIIPRDQILFIENMKDDSDVVNLIRRFKSGQLPVATPPPATAAPSSPRPSATR